MILNDKNEQLDDLLNRVALDLQLDKTRREKIEDTYKAVQKWIDEDEGFFKNTRFEVYPHGSVRIGTTVKPLNEEQDFDLDIVIHIDTNWSNVDPFKVYDELKRRLSENETYKNMLELKSRVVRLNYAGDFHMDIMPVCQEEGSDANRVVVPDKKKEEWVSSNPRGFADWFATKANTIKISLLEKAYNAEALPDEVPFELSKPLNRAVQLIKRYRDIYFQDNPELATSSIILTTLSGKYYNGEDSIYESVNNIVQKIFEVSKSVDLESPFIISNPVNSEEKFSDKWIDEPGLYTAFINFAYDLKEKWDQLKNAKSVIENSNTIKDLFGNKAGNSAIKGQAKWIGELRNNGLLGVDKSTGLIDEINPINKPDIEPIRKNTFHGDV